MFVITVIPKVFSFVIDVSARLILQCFITMLNYFFNLCVAPSFDIASIDFDSLTNLYGGKYYNENRRSL